MLQIRQYQDADHDEVFALHNLALHQVGAHVGNGPWDDDLHRVRQVYLDGGGEFLVGLIEGRIVAMGALRRIDGTSAEVTRMRVHPDHQRCGYGEAILARLEQRARELGYRGLQLSTTVAQVAAQKLYEANDYRRTGQRRFAGFDVLIYEKRLDG
jgi:ribosomal protein S18 acetylase RimI-like enzyme